MLICQTCGMEYDTPACPSCGGKLKALNTEPDSEQGSEGLEFTKKGDGYEVTGIGSCKSHDIVIPSRHCGLPVTGIGERAFCGFGFINSVVIPSGVVSISFSAFSDCACLKKIDIPESVIRIAPWAFRGSGLKEVRLPSSLSVIECAVFALCTSLERIDIPMCVLSVENSAFYGCDSLKEVNFLGDGVGVIGSWAFYSCAFSEMTLPERLHEVGPHAFRACGNLTKVTLHSKVGEIGHDAFRDCLSLKEADIGSDVTIMGFQVFAGCSVLEKVTFRGFVQNIPQFAFFECVALEYVSLPDGVEHIDREAFRGCSNLKEIILPKTLLCVGACAFDGCISLSSIFYKGSMNSYDKLVVGDCNDVLMSSPPVCIYSAQRPKPVPGRFWRFIGGRPVIWR